MANTKTGMSYYPVDTDRYQDRRIKRLKKDMGCKGIAVYDFLLCETYRVRGCFLEWDENTAFDVAEYFGLEENSVKEIVRYCGSVGLFNKALLSRGIITSGAIQRRYMEMCARTHRRAEIPEKCRIPQDNDSENPRDDDRHQMSLDEEVETLKNDNNWCAEIQHTYSIDVVELRKYLDDFRSQCIGDGKDRHQSIQDAKQHFNAWLRIIVTKKSSKKDVKDRSGRRDKRRSNILSPDETKTYGDSF